MLIQIPACIATLTASLVRQICDVPNRRYACGAVLLAINPLKNRRFEKSLNERCDDLNINRLETTKSNRVQQSLSMVRDQVGNSNLLLATSLFCGLHTFRISKAGAMEFPKRQVASE